MWIGFWLLVRSENQMLSACVIVRPADERDMSPTLKSSRYGPSVTGAMLDAFASRSGRRRDRLLRDGCESDVQRTHPRMDLGVAIGAEHHAVFQFLLDSFPAAVNSVDRDRELLLSRVGMVELQSRRRVARTTCQTHSAE